MVSIVKFVNEAEDKYGSIAKAPINCKQFVKVRSILKFKDPEIKQVDVVRILGFIERGYVASEIASICRVSLSTVQKVARKNELKFHQIYRYEYTSNDGKHYLSASRKAMLKRFPPYSIKKTFIRYKDVKPETFYYEKGKWNWK